MLSPHPLQTRSVGQPVVSASVSNRHEDDPRLQAVLSAAFEQFHNLFSQEPISDKAKRAAAIADQFSKKRLTTLLNNLKTIGVIDDDFDVTEVYDSERREDQRRLSLVIRKYNAAQISLFVDTTKKLGLVPCTLCGNLTAERDSNFLAIYTYTPSWNDYDGKGNGDFYEAQSSHTLYRSCPSCLASKQAEEVWVKNNKYSGRTYSAKVYTDVEDFKQKNQNSGRLELLVEPSKIPLMFGIEMRILPLATFSNGPFIRLYYGNNGEEWDQQFPYTDFIPAQH